MVLPLLLIVAAAPLLALMSGRGGGRGGGRGRGLGRGRGMTPARGDVWDPKGPHARHILRGYLAGNSDFVNWDAFKAAHSNWIITELNPYPIGHYAHDNLRRNFNNTISRYHKHIDPNDPYDGGSVGHRCSSSVILLIAVSHVLLLLHHQAVTPTSSCVILVHQGCPRRIHKDSTLFQVTTNSSTSTLRPTFQPKSWKIQSQKRSQKKKSQKRNQPQSFCSRSTTLHRLFRTSTCQPTPSPASHFMRLPSRSKAKTLMQSPMQWVLFAFSEREQC